MAPATALAASGRRGQSLIRVLALSLVILLGWPESAWMPTMPAAFGFDGDVEMNRTAKRFGVPPVVFPHWAHRVQFTCPVCHPSIFRMEAGAHEIMMERMVARRLFCSSCHDGRTAWRPVNCRRCHLGRNDANERPRPTELPSPGPPFSVENGNPNVLFGSFPRDLDGNIDWIAALDRRLISPRSALSSSPQEKVAVPPDLMMRRTAGMAAVVFSHAAHGRWLACKNCHPSLFLPNSGTNPASMADMLAGRSCGKCHGRVAFPVTRCERCHRAVPPSQTTPQSAESVR